MTRKSATPPEDRPMPPLPALGGCWRFDPVQWAYVPDTPAPVATPAATGADTEGDR